MIKLNKFLLATGASFLLLSNFAFAMPDDHDYIPKYCPDFTSGTRIVKGQKDPAQECEFGSCSIGPVRKLQKFLTDYYDLPADFPTGYFGVRTDFYVQKFKKEQGLARVSTVGVATIAKISDVCIKTIGGATESTDQANSNVSQNYSAFPVGTYYEDFNFDGLQDKLIITGLGSGSIFVQTTSSNYILSDELNKILYIGERGYFKVDRTNKTILTGGDMGGGNHYDAKYIVVPGVGLKLISRNDYNVNSPQSVNVSGMKKYTDTDFGFSFWYPSNWSVDPNFCGGTNISNNSCIGIRSNEVQIVISKYDNPDLTFKVAAGACGYCDPRTYNFDVTKHLWMLNKTTPADITNNSMGGLHLFSTGQRESATIVPLSGRHFLFIRDNKYSDMCGPSCADPSILGGAQFIAKTIVAADPAVAVPVSVSEQQNTVLSERRGYLGY